MGCKANIHGRVRQGEKEQKERGKGTGEEAQAEGDMGQVALGEASNI